MQTRLSPLEVLILWGLLGNGGAQWLNEIKPKLQPRNRENLQKAGLIVVEKKKNSKNRDATWIEVADKGWAWAAENSMQKLATAPLLPARSSKPGSRGSRPTCSAAMYRSPRSWPRRRRLLPNCPSVSPKPTLRYRGSSAKRVRLSQLRDRLADVRRQDLDNTILGMQGQSKLVLYALDNPSEITAQDQHAAILIGREPRHILYMPR